ncbi:MAG: hypothetical protein M3P18_15685, partial [Actinomycetota bacterium]|nr:hypothetical protein [Actinomycetota bacterium]
MRSADHLVSLAFAMLDVALGLAGAVLVVAVALIALACVRVARTPDLVVYEIVPPREPPPAPEHLFTHLHVLFGGRISSLLGRGSLVVLIARGTEAGLRLAIAMDAGDVPRVAAGLETLWPGTRLAAASAMPKGVAVVLEWCP